MTTELFSDIKTTKLTLENSKMKGRGSVVVSGVVKINFTIVEGSTGLFVSLPREKGAKKDDEGKDQYFPLVSMTDRDLSDQLNKAVLAVFEGGASQPATKTASTVYKKPGKVIGF